MGKYSKKSIIMLLVCFITVFMLSGEVLADTSLTGNEVNMVNSAYAGAFVHDNGMVTMAGSRQVFGLGKPKEYSGYTSNLGNSKDWAVIAANDNSIYGIKKNGTMWSWGFNDVGQLGDGTTTNRYKPVQIGKDIKWKTVSSNYGHAVAISREGYLYTWGANWSGQLGNGTTNNSSKPIKIGKDKDWVEAYAGGYHTLAFKKDGSMWAWGAGSAGRLGNKNDKNVLHPVKVAKNMEHKSIALGSIHTLMVKKDGSLWAWGGNSNGQLGNGTKEDMNKPVRIGKSKNWVRVYATEEMSFGIKKDGTLWAWGYLGYFLDIEDDAVTKPTQVGTDKDWVSVSNGSTSCKFVYFLKKDGTVYGFGNNGNDQLLLGLEETRHEADLIKVNYNVKKRKVTLK